MKTLRLIPLVVALAACSSVNIPVSPYRIDVQQGNALEQEAVDKLKVGMTTAQVRFLLGTPLLIDPFRNNRWDYVYNFRKAGKLTEKRRLALFFEGDVLARIEAEGFAPKSPAPDQAQPLAAKPAEKPADMPVETAKPVTPEPVQTASVKTSAPPVAAVQPSAPAVQVAPSASPAQVAVEQPPAAKPAPVAVTPAPAQAPTPVAAGRSLNETSIVPPLAAQSPKSAELPRKPAPVSEKPPEPMALQQETNVARVVPEAVPAFPNATATAATAEEQVMAAINAWANAWKTRDEEAYLAAYAATFQPQGGLSRAEWEKRRRLLLGVSRNIDLKIDGHAFESVTEDHAQVSFRQFYRSDSHQDAVIKQLKLVRVDNLWLIEEEKVLAPIKIKK